MNENTMNSGRIRHGVELMRESLPNQIVERLSDFYRQYFSEKSTDFRTDYFQPMFADKSLSGAKLEQEFYDSKKEDMTIITLMRLSCAYCIDSMRANESGCHDEAWLYASFAQYWLGIVNGTKFIDGTAKLALSLRGKDAAKARDKRYDVLRDRAIQLVKLKKYPSRRNAALSIRAEILQLSNEKNINLKPDQAERTIISWLKDIQFGGKPIL